MKKDIHYFLLAPVIAIGIFATWVFAQKRSVERVKAKNMQLGDDLLRIDRRLEALKKE